MENYPDVLSVQQTSDIMMVSKKTLYKLIAEGKLTAVKVGRSFRIPKVRLLHYLGIEHF